MMAVDMNASEVEAKSERALPERLARVVVIDAEETVREVANLFLLSDGRIARVLRTKMRAGHTENDIDTATYVTIDPNHLQKATKSAVGSIEKKYVKNTIVIDGRPKMFVAVDDGTKHLLHAALSVCRMKAPSRDYRHWDPMHGPAPL